jgi:hypothetical protein
MKMAQIILALLVSLSITNVEARISDDLRAHLPQYLVDVQFNQESYDDVIVVRATEVKRTAFAKPIFMEVEISNVDYFREIYVVNSSNIDQRENRETAARFISDSSVDEWMNTEAATGRPLVIYAGEARENKSRFLILSPGTSPATYIDIYVKMNGKQFTNRVFIKGAFN